MGWIKEVIRHRSVDVAKDHQGYYVKVVVSPQEWLQHGHTIKTRVQRHGKLTVEHTGQHLLFRLADPTTDIAQAFKSLSI